MGPMQRHEVQQAIERAKQDVMHHVYESQRKIEQLQRELREEVSNRQSEDGYIRDDADRHTHEHTHDSNGGVQY
jgi:hypothetical protein